MGINANAYSRLSHIDTQTLNAQKQGLNNACIASSGYCKDLQTFSGQYVAARGWNNCFKVIQQLHNCTNTLLKMKMHK